MSCVLATMKLIRNFVTICVYLGLRKGQERGLLGTVIKSYSYFSDR